MNHCDPTITPTSSLTVFGSFSGLFLAWLPQLQNIPSTTWLAVLGTIGSLAVPVVVALINRSGSRAMAEKDLENARLRREGDNMFCELAVLRDLVEKAGH